MDEIKIIFQDDYIIVIDKPSGLVVTKSETTKDQPTLEDWLKSYYEKLAYHSGLDRMGIVHRIDKDTSGLLIVAKTQAAFEDLQNQFKSRKVKKEYLALSHGWVEKSGRVEGSIGRNPKNREKFIVLQEGKEAVTEYESLRQYQISNIKYQIIFNEMNKIQLRKLDRMKYNQFTLLKCLPQTGRTHQIRVHLKYINHPIVSDEKYVGRKMYRLDKRWCPRMFLHAKKIGFNHPESGKWMELESELPEDLANALTRIGSSKK